MTIDEAIAHAREVAKEQKSKYDKCPTRTRYNCAMCFHNPKCDEDAKEHEQLAEWLEELKIYQQHEIICNKGYNAGYNKAIDDFVKLVHKHDWNIRNINENSFIYGAIDTLAEQLKAGGENDNLRR